MTKAPAPTEPGPRAVATEKIRRITLIVLALFPVLFAASFAVDAWRARGPDLGFGSFTGVELPDGILTVEHTTRFTEMSARRGHFWLLDGNREKFRALAEAARLNRSGDDAKALLRPALFDGKLPEVMAAYESNPDEGGRIRRLFVLYPGSLAVFEY